MSPNFGVRPAANKNFYLCLMVEKIIRLRFSARNINGRAAVLSPILRLRLTGHTQKLKYIVVPLKYEIVKIKLSVLIKKYFCFVSNTFFCL